MIIPGTLATVVEISSRYSMSAGAVEENAPSPVAISAAVRSGALLFFLTIFTAIASAAAKPNILILVADDLGYSDVGFNGGRVIATPNLDRLAATGINLTNFRACPMCSPTRAGLLTGRWPSRFGMMRAVVPPWSTYGLPAEERTLPELLAEAGYERRGIMGKWHLGHAKRAFLPLAHGFTKFVGCYNGAIDYVTHERDGQRDWHDDDRSVQEEGYSTDLIADAAIRFLAEAPAEKPWLLYVPFNAPHAPHQAKDPERKKYLNVEAGVRRIYAAMVDSMDQAIGRILAAVDAKADAANTLVLFFSDNGGILRVGSRNGIYRGGKLTAYEGGTRVCAAIRWPAGGLSAGKTFDGRIGYIDVLPTALAAAGAKIPAEIDGVNFLPALRGETALPERPWFSYMDQDGDAHASVHLGNSKLVAHGDFFSEKPATAPKLELYDLNADPAESRDIATQQPEMVKDLHRRLREFGTWQKAGVTRYDEGRKGFVPPKDWVIAE
jgi:arylsulfatase A-like enzyme